MPYDIAISLPWDISGYRIRVASGGMSSPSK
ncbi:hypothetical protein C356_00986 [Cryptococcus neoformans c45]|nr:hypothetical protein C356_00986 [Cryptococcus neoformans var. grubii c45]